MTAPLLSGQLRRYLGSLVEPMLLYLVLILILVWARTSLTEPSTIYAVVTVYEVFPLAVLRFLHHEPLLARLGIRVRTRTEAFYAASVLIASTAIVLVNTQPPNYSNLGTLLLAPIGEEVFFRSYMLGSMSKFGKYLFVVVTAFLFGSAHFMVSSMDVGTALIYSVGGCILGLAYLYLGSIVLPIMIHQTINMYAIGYHTAAAFPMNFVGALAFLAPIAVMFAGARAYIYEFHMKKPIPTCWMCGRTEKEIRSLIHASKYVLEDYPVADATVKLCTICKQLHSVS